MRIPRVRPVPKMIGAALDRWDRELVVVEETADAVGVVAVDADADKSASVIAELSLADVVEVSKIDRVLDGVIVEAVRLRIALVPISPTL